MGKKIVEYGGGDSAKDEIIAGLTKLMRKYELEKNKGKSIMYRKAIVSLRCFNREIRNSYDVRRLPGIGNSICQKIDEYFRNDRFMEVEDPFDRDKMAAIDELSKVWMIGDSRAAILYDKGFRSVDELRNKPGGLAELYSLEKIGLRYHEDINQKIPRVEVA